MKKGEFYVWLTGAALSASLIMLSGLLLHISVNGLRSFWPAKVALIEKTGGDKVIGEIVDYDRSAEGAVRLKVKRGNRDQYGLDFVWLNQSDIASISYPPDISVLERLEWGNYYGIVQASPGAMDLPAGSNSLHQHFSTQLQQSQQLLGRIKKIERAELTPLAERQRAIELKLRSRSFAGLGDDAVQKLELERERQNLIEQFRTTNAALDNLRSELTGQVVMINAEGELYPVELAKVTRFYQPNSLGLFQRVALYLSNIFLFITAEPREANTEGGVFPALFGTAVLVMVMSIIVTPFGVVAAVYLHEYANPGVLVNLIRIAVKNLAGVPSIVYGVFGLGFFIYGIGSSIDHLFFSERLPNPTFGTGGLLWAALTLALLTLPTVIVATEEGLSAIPKNWREGSYALGATKFETTVRVVLPALLPSILTGVILAVARGAGEVAPLMVTGVVKLAPALPIDASFPFFHLERKFMHLGFHIYDLGFQSPNVDASRPTVYATALLLIFLVLILNLLAIVLRNKIRNRHRSSAV